MGERNLVELVPWQRQVLYRWVCVSVPRQSGKTTPGAGS